MSRKAKAKHNLGALKLEQVMQLIGRETLIRWQPSVSPRQPGEALQTHLRRLDAFDLESSEQAKILLIDALFAEIVTDHPKLKIWKAETLETDTLIGIADYLIAPRRAYLATPLLCVAEAKRDDFEKGRIQCLGEMYACQWNNRHHGLDLDIFGIVSNGQGWRFYKLTIAGDAYETDLFALGDMATLLGVLDYVCGECARNAP
jgi:hypothetical protein